MLRSAFSFALLAVLAMGCTSHRLDPVALVPFEQSVVRTSDDAIATALLYMQENGWTEGYNFGSAEAQEEPASWVVSVPYTAETRPPATIIVVSKLDGTARLFPTR